MSKANIHGAEYPILKVFSDDFVFTIPNFQRPYAWATDQAGDLLEDLLTFMGDGNEQVEMLSPYFLGSIVLIKGDRPDAKVVDGQQRLTTLTILLSVLRSLVPSEHEEVLTKLLYDKGSIITGIADSYRLSLRERDNPFFQKYIQRRDNLNGGEGIKALKTLEGSLSESKKNIRDNAMLFVRRLESLTEQQCVRLAQFILTRCFLIVVSTPDLDSAYRIFSVLNDRGLDLSHTDILKAEIIGEIKQQQEQDAYNAKWEEIEASLGREMFQKLFAYIRAIYRKVKPQDSILKDFRSYIRPTEHPQKFIDDCLEPYATAFYNINYENYKSIKDAEKVNSLFKWLNRIDNSDWLPPAILYYSQNPHNTNALMRFYTDLERLAAGLMFLRANVNKRIERYARLIAAIENGDDLYVFNGPLQLTPEHNTEHTRRWGAFCAASVEFLCGGYSVPCPEWVYYPRYTLTTPWWPEHTYDLSTRRQLLQTTPIPFKQRHIFCGNRLYQNKYEMSAWTQEARAKGMTNPGEIFRYAGQKEISIHGG